MRRGVPCGSSLSGFCVASSPSPQHLLLGRLRSSLSSFSVCPPVPFLATLHSLSGAFTLPEPSPSTPQLRHSRFHVSCTSAMSLPSRNHFSYLFLFMVRRLPALPLVFSLCFPLLHCHPLLLPVCGSSVSSGNEKSRYHSRRVFFSVRLSRPCTRFPQRVAGPIPHAVVEWRSNTCRHLPTRSFPPGGAR
jgi:hypothetical protein